MRTKLFITTFSVVLLFCVTANAQRARTPRKPAKPPAKPTTVANTKDIFGIFEERVYINKFFGFRVAVPDDMTIVDRVEQELYTEAGIDSMKAQSKGSTSQLDAAAKRTIQMFMVTKLPVGTVGNSAIEFGTTKQVAGVTSKMALAASIAVMTSTGSFKVVNRPGARKLGLYTYEIGDYESTAFGVPLDHRMFVVMLKGYSFVITITKQKSDSYDEFEELIKSIELIKK